MYFLSFFLQDAKNVAGILLINREGIPIKGSSDLLLLPKWSNFRGLYYKTQRIRCNKLASYIIRTHPQSH